MLLFSPGWRAPVRQAPVLAVFTLGLLLGGTLSGAVLWLLSGLAAPLPRAVRVPAILLVAALGVVRDAGLIRIRLPQNARQIPQEVLRRGVLRGALRFGFELGTGVRTYIPASAPYVVALTVLLGHPGPAAILAGTGFGLGRAITATARYASRDEEWDGRRVARVPALTGAAGVVVLVSLALLVWP